jgi:hypothetical protein
MPVAVRDRGEQVRLRIGYETLQCLQIGTRGFKDSLSARRIRGRPPRQAKSHLGTRAKSTQHSSRLIEVNDPWGDGRGARFR